MQEGGTTSSASSKSFLMSMYEGWEWDERRRGERWRGGGGEGERWREVRDILMFVPAWTLCYMNVPS